MDVPPQFAAIARELLDAVADIRKALQEHTKAVAEATQTKKAQQGITPKVLAEVNLPKAVETRKSTADADDDKSFQRRTLIVAWLTLAAIVFYGAVAYLQWKEMIGATGAAQDAVHEARLSRQGAEKSLGAAIEQFRLDQRAWVGAKSFDTPPLEANKPVTAVVHFMNTGKTLANHTVGDVVIKPSPEKLDIAKFAVSKDRPRPKSHNPIAMFPNMDFSLPIATPETATTQDIQNIKDGKLFIYVFGEIHYMDIFQRPHVTHYCGVLNASVTPQIYNACDTYNDAD